MTLENLLTLRESKPSNPFFIHHGDVPNRPPQNGYFKVDQSEPPVLDQDTQKAVFRLEGVDGDWLRKNEPPPDKYWKKLFAFNDIDPKRGKDRPNLPKDHYSGMPLYHLEVSCERGGGTFELFEKLLFKDHGGWIVSKLDNISNDSADYYSSLFGTPVSEPTHFTRADLEDEKLLALWFSMDTWPDASEKELKQALGRNHKIKCLVAYDIGQGSANGLLDDCMGIPQLYFDLGCGCLGNSKTAPNPPPLFCWTNNPPVILSHWDTDHWAAAQKDRAALGQTWIAPRDKSVGSNHIAFANDILRNGGRLLIWGQCQKYISTKLFASGGKMIVGRCTGLDRNGSGLAMIVDDGGKTSQGWLLTGDAGYLEVPLPLPKELTAVIVPHHGADMKGKNFPIPQRPTTGTDARLIYSFGPNNAFGRHGISHPRAATVTDHENVGWDHLGWRGQAIPGGTPLAQTADAVATAQHSVTHPGTHLGGILGGCLGGCLGGVRASAPLTLPCRGTGCNTSVTQ